MINTGECLMMIDKSETEGGKGEPLTVSIQIPEMSASVNALKSVNGRGNEVIEQGKLGVSVRANSKGITGN